MNDTAVGGLFEDFTQASLAGGPVRISIFFN
jgi:hypothetical protein